MAIIGDGDWEKAYQEIEDALKDYKNNIQSIIGIYKRIKNILLAHNLEITEENKGIDVEDKNIGATKLELMSNFGTAKAQKMAINMKTNIVGEENIASANAAKQILKEFAENREQISMQEEAKKNQLETMKDILPAFDLKTNDVKKIFDFNSVVDRTVLLSWNVDHITEILMNKGVGLNDPKLGLCEYAIEFLKSISKNVMKGTDQSNKIRMVLYLNELIRFYLLPKIIT